MVEGTQGIPSGRITPFSTNFSFTILRNATANCLQSSLLGQGVFLCTRVIKKTKKASTNINAEYRFWVKLAALRSAGTLPSPVVEPGFNLSAAEFDLLLCGASSLENFSPSRGIRERGLKTE